MYSTVILRASRDEEAKTLFAQAIAPLNDTVWKSFANWTEEYNIIRSVTFEMALTHHFARASLVTETNEGHHPFRRSAAAQAVVNLGTSELANKLASKSLDL